jgi:hypothetical protein
MREHLRQKPWSLNNVISEVTSYHFSCFLFIRNKPKSPAHGQEGMGFTGSRVGTAYHTYKLVSSLVYRDCIIQFIMFLTESQ